MADETIQSAMDAIFAKIRSPRSPRTPMIPGFAGAGGGGVSNSTTTHGDTFILDGQSFQPETYDEEQAFALIGARLRQHAFTSARN